MKKKLLSLLLLGGLTLTAGAQQLPNIGFANWKSACGSTEGFGTGKYGNSPITGEMRQRPGIEPEEWNGSSVNQYVSNNTKTQELIFQDDNAVKMQNQFVGFMSIGSVAPGFINLGTPWVYAATKNIFTVSPDCDGGVYGGVAFSYKPDAIIGRYKRTDSTNEKSHIIVYTWSGNFQSKVGPKSAPDQTRDNVDRAILGKVTPTASGTLIASCDYTFTSTTGSGWQTITVPLTYHNTTTAPTMMNAIISAGDYWTRENMKENTTLYADDVKFVYYSTLKTLTYNGESVSFPKYGGEVVIVSDGDYDASKLSYTLNGQTASATKSSYDASTQSVTITVSNVDADEDGNSTHTYTIKFAKPGTAALTDLKYNGTTLTGFSSSTYEYTLEGSKYTEGCLTYTKEDGEDATANVSFAGENGYGVATITVTATNGGASKVYTVNFTKKCLSSTDYVDNLLVVVNGEYSDPQKTTINVSKYEDNTYTLSLQNFMLVAGEDLIPIGNIVLGGMTATEDNGTLTFNTAQTIQIQPGTLAGISPEEWWGPMLGDVPIVMSATLYADKMYCEIDIDMQESLGQVINVVFGKPIVAQTQSAALAETGEAHVVLNRQFLKGWNTICLPFATTPEAVAGTGAKAQAFAGAGADGLDFVVAETMTANTPYLIYVPADTEAQTFIANVTLEEATPASVTHGDFTFKGNYVANMPMADLYGVADKDGVQKIMKGSATAKLQGTRAYFDYSGTSSVSGMRLNLEGQDDVTSIDGVEVMNGSFDIYNLQGIRVRTAATSLEGLGRGVYVVNGKKVMVK